ncbi:hypothetical protein Q7C36_001498 [Tachysurus vachellii]|uniref:Uncharacterized protein n=1 Tax=Tachysurus vachellii TaxID=175792 RepID=A0AA88T945_TACVA|nr:hypothetical protein Q7C36_001498 [Tachysurus vachellii]
MEVGEEGCEFRTPPEHEAVLMEDGKKGNLLLVWRSEFNHASPPSLVLPSDLLLGVKFSPRGSVLSQRHGHMGASAYRRPADSARAQAVAFTPR